MKAKVHEVSFLNIKVKCKVKSKKRKLTNAKMVRVLGQIGEHQSAIGSDKSAKEAVQKRPKSGSKSGCRSGGRPLSDHIRGHRIEVG